MLACLIMKNFFGYQSCYVLQSFVNSVRMSENRLKNFKNKGKDNDELRRRRNEVSIELRKNKKDDMLSKRRNVGPEEDLALSPLQENKQSPLLSIEEIQNGIQSQDGHKQLQATQSARKILSRERNPPIDVMINLGILKFRHKPILQGSGQLHEKHSPDRPQGHPPSS